MTPTSGQYHVINTINHSYHLNSFCSTRCVNRVRIESFKSFQSPLINSYGAWQKSYTTKRVVEAQRA